MASMVPITCAMARAAALRHGRAERARLSAWRALSLLLRTVPVSSIIDEAVSSSALACASVRADRSALPLAISLDATAMVPVPPRTCPTSAARLLFMSRSACSSWPVSSLPSATILLLRSPAATALRHAQGICERRGDRARDPPGKDARPAAGRRRPGWPSAHSPRKYSAGSAAPPCTTTARCRSLRRLTVACRRLRAGRVSSRTCTAACCALAGHQQLVGLAERDDISLALLFQGGQQLLAFRQARPGGRARQRTW